MFRLARIVPHLAASTLVLALVTPARSAQPPELASESQEDARSASGSVSASPSATAERWLDAQRWFYAVKARGALLGNRERARSESKIDLWALQVDRLGRTEAKAVAGRMAEEFGVSRETIAREKDRLAASWGDLTIAHTLEANSRCGLTARQFFKLHDDGMSWSEIAYGLGLGLSQFKSAVQIECRVASGKSSADGRVAFIRAEAPAPAIGDRGDDVGEVGAPDASGPVGASMPRRGGGSP